MAEVSKCCIFSKVVWQLFVTLACAGLAFAGVVLIKQNVEDAQTETDAAIDALGVRKDNLKYYNDIPKYSNTAVAIVATAASIALLLGIIRVLLMCCATGRPGAYPRRTTTLHLAINILSMVFSWVASAFMVFAMCAATLYFAACLIADQGSGQLLKSDLDTKWSQITIAYQKIVALLSEYQPLVQDLAQVAPEIEKVLTPAITAADLVLPQPGDACSKTCLDLSTISIFDTSNSTRCLCDLDRLQAMQPYMKNAWQQHLSLVLLGIVLAWLGMSWIALDQTAQITRAMGELHHDKTLAAAAPPLASDHSAQDVYKPYVMSNGGYASSPGVPMSVQQDTAPATDQYHAAPQHASSRYRYSGV